jgi:hypothetical protein
MNFYARLPVPSLPPSPHQQAKVGSGVDRFSLARVTIRPQPLSVATQGKKTAEIIITTGMKKKSDTALPCLNNETAGGYQHGL